MQSLNSFKVLSLLIRELGITVTQTSILEELQKHPDATSLLAFSDLLDRWGVPNAAYQVSVSEILDAELPIPFIACFKKSEFVLVSQKTNEKFIVSNDRWQNYSLPIEQFQKLYEGTILAVEKDINSGEPDYYAKRRKERIEELRLPFAISGIIIMLILQVWLNRYNTLPLNLHLGLLTFFKVAGLIASILLLVQSINANNPLIKKVCGNDSNKNCNAILSSKAATIFGGISWSEIGFFYFAGTLLSLLFNHNNESVIRYLAILNGLSLPYTVYSFYYQWRIAKQWCVFCSSVQVLLWLECLTFSVFNKGHSCF